MYEIYDACITLWSKKMDLNINLIGDWSVNIEMSVDVSNWSRVDWARRKMMKTEVRANEVVDRKLEEM